MLVALTPLFLFPAIGHPVLSFIIFLPALWLRQDPLPMTPFNGAIALLTFMVLVSLWATFDIFFSAGKVLGVVFGIAVYFALVRHLKTNKSVVVALQFFVIAAVALAVLGLLGTNWIGKVAFVGSVTSRLPAVIRGVPGQSEGFQPNAIAGALIMFIPLQMALVAAGLRRMLHGLALLMTGGTLVLTQSRNGWLSLIAALVGWSLWEKRSRRVAAAIIVIVLATMVISFNQIALVLESRAGKGIREDVAERLELWSRAVNGIEDFPMTGMGMNTFRRVMPVVYPTSTSSPDLDVAHAHNALLQAALDVGLPGLVAYLAIWFGIAHLLWRVHRDGGPRDRLLAGGLGAGMLAYFLFGTADTIALGAKLGIFFWVALALITSMYLTREAKP